MGVEFTTFSSTSPVSALYENPISSTELLFDCLRCAIKPLSVSEACKPLCKRRHTCLYTNFCSSN